MTDSLVARTLALAVLVSGSAVSLAHHSDALYSQDINQLTGEVVSLKWRNPHVTWTFKALDDAGAESLWIVEAPSTYSMKRAGVDRDLFKPGTQMTLLGRLSTKEEQVLLATDMRLPGGREFQFNVPVPASMLDKKLRLKP